jgi:four helix bundle protein
MAEIRSFRDLNVYKSAREAARAIFEASKTFPRDERFSLTDQIRRSSRAVNAMIAEAAFVNKVNDALGEATETQSWLDHAVDSGYITPAQFKELDAKWQQIGAMLNKMTERAHDFCKSQTR